MLDSTFMRRSASIALLVVPLLAAACGPARDASLDELAATLRATTPSEARTSLDADLDALATLSREEKLGTPEREALVDLFRSTTQDGTLDDDERMLLVHLVRDVVAAGGSIALEKRTTGGST